MGKKKRDPSLSHQTLRVLKTLFEAPDSGLAGADICKRLDICTGTVYPILNRLSVAGWITGTWEKAKAQELGRPRKCFYRLTLLGSTKTHEALEAFRL